MKNHIIVFLILFLLHSNLIAQKNYTDLPQSNCFIKNMGQWSSEVKYLARIKGMNAWITNTGIVYDYYLIKENYDEVNTSKMDKQEIINFENTNSEIKGDIIRMQLINSEKNCSILGNDQLEGYYNYFIGNNKKNWVSKVPIYNKIEIKGIYKNIDLRYYFDNGQLRYDYIVKPEVTLSKIKFKFEGQKGIKIKANGEMVLKTSIGKIYNGKIYAYQNIDGYRKEVECKFIQKRGGIVGLEAVNYLANLELIIDPLVYSTFIGGSYDDVGAAIAIDNNGNTYITGYTVSQNFPTTPGSYQKEFSNDIEVFVTKVNAIGNTALYSTFIGEAVNINAIALDANNNVYITGSTISQNFPTTSGAYQTNNAGKNDIFVTKLNSSGSELVYSTFIGGNDDDFGNSLVTDIMGAVYITGSTASLNYPTTNGAYQTNNGGKNDVFITKLNPAGEGLNYSTLIGGKYDDISTAIALDTKGNAYITGFTTFFYPITNGINQNLNMSGFSTFVTKVNSNGSFLIYSVKFGGHSNDLAYSIAVDANNNAYITGQTNSTNFPTTSGAYQANNVGKNDVFVTKLNSAGNGLIYSTLIGGNDDDYAKSIVLDNISNAYITGHTVSENFPTTSNAFQTSNGGKNDVFVTKLNSSGSELVYSTFIGGNDDDFGNSLVTDIMGAVYITGKTKSYNYPITNGSFQTTHWGYYDAFITKLESVGQADDLPLPIDISFSYPYSSNLSGKFILPWEPFYKQNRFLVEISINNISAINKKINNLKIEATLDDNPIEFQLNNIFKLDKNNDGIIDEYPISIFGNPFTDDDYPITEKVSLEFLAMTTNEFQSNFENKVFTFKIIGANGTEINISKQAVIDMYFAHNKDTQRIYSNSIDSYSFQNPSGSMSFDEFAYYINTQGTKVEGIITYLFYKALTWGGKCFGMAATAGQYFLMPNTKPLEGNVYSWDESSNIVMDKINRSFIIQFLYAFYNNRDIATQYEKLKSILSVDKPAVLGLYGIKDNHAVLATKLTVFNNKQAYIDIYDNNRPKLSSAANIDLTKNDFFYLFHPSDNFTTLPPSVFTTTSVANAIADFFNKFINPIRGFKFFGIACPVNPIVENKMGQKIGILDDGKEINEIPGSKLYRLPTYNEDSDSLTIILVPDNYDYTLKMNSYKSGKLHFERITQISNNQLRSVYVDSINISATTIVHYADSMSSTVQIDMDGDNIIDSTFSTNNEIVTNISNQKNTIPLNYELLQNYPNPFNPVTRIIYKIPKESYVKITVYDLLGHEIKTLANEEKSAGSYDITFNAANLPSGIYFYRLQAGDFVETKKMILLK